MGAKRRRARDLELALRVAHALQLSPLVRLRHLRGLQLLAELRRTRREHLHLRLVDARLYFVRDDTESV